MVDKIIITIFLNLLSLAIAQEDKSTALGAIADLRAYLDNIE